MMTRRYGATQMPQCSRETQALVRYWDGKSDAEWTQHYYHIWHPEQRAACLTCLVICVRGVSGE